MAEPILIDTSVWIDFFRAKETKECKLLYNYIAEEQPVILCPPVIQEILQGIKSDSDYEEIKESILSFDILNIDPVEAAIGSADLHRLLRKRGVTIKKSNDCLIAFFGIYFNVPLLHRDYEFELIAKFLPLKIKH